MRSTSSTETDDDDILSNLGSCDGEPEELLTLDGVHVKANKKRDKLQEGLRASPCTNIGDDDKKNADDDDEKRATDSIGMFFGVQPGDRLVARAAYDSLLTRLGQLEAHLAAATRELRLEQDRSRESQDKCSELAQALKIAGETLKAEVDQQRELKRKLQQKEDELLLREHALALEMEQRLRGCSGFRDLPTSKDAYQHATRDYPPLTVGPMAVSTRHNRSPVPTVATAQPQTQPTRLPRLSHPHGHPTLPPSTSHAAHNPLPPELTARGGGRLTSLGFA